MSKIQVIPKHILNQLPKCMDEEWMAFATENMWWASMNIGSLQKFTEVFSAGTPEEHALFFALHKKLLSFGGCETCFPEIDEDVKRILERGYLRNGTSKLMRGQPCRCHSNVCNLWEQNHAEHDVRICTGYALSDDGMWRSHTWMLHVYDTATQRREQVIETTEKRIAYFGFEMTDAEAEVFCYAN